jgi:hypothetical protein
VAVREWIRNFFNCEDCRAHFLTVRALQTV